MHHYYVSTSEGRLKFYEDLLKVVTEDPNVNTGFCSYTQNMGVHISRLPELIDECINHPEYSGTGSRILPYFDYFFELNEQGWQYRIDCLVNVINKIKK